MRYYLYGREEKKSVEHENTNKIDIYINSFVSKKIAKIEYMECIRAPCIFSILDESFFLDFQPTYHGHRY